MRVLLINPNISVEMTERITQEARRHSDTGTEIMSVTASFGCEVIASRASFAIAAHAALDAYARHADGIDAVLLACFGDPGLEALREIATVPVFGLLDSSLKQAASKGRSFATLTAGACWTEMLDERIRLSPHGALNRGVFAINSTGLSVSRDPDGSVQSLQTALDSAIASGAEAVMLGGSALAGFAPRLANGKVALIDPLQAGMRDLQDGAKQTQRTQSKAPPQLISHGLNVKLERLLNEAVRIQTLNGVA